MRYAAILLVVLLAACAGSGKRSDRLISQVADGVSEQRFRVSIREFGKHMVADIVRASEKIKTETGDLEVRRNALTWKLNAIPSVYGAVFNVDPVAGLIDVWAYTVEMHDFFDGGAGKSVFGDQQEVAVATCRALEEKIAALTTELVGGRDPARARELVAQWAQEHPIEDMLFVRESTNVLTLELVANKSGGTFAAVESMEEQLEELTYRLTVMAGVLPLLVEWQAELILLDATGGEGLDPTIDRFAKLEGHVAHVSEFLDEMPNTIKTLVDLQRDAALEAINELVAAEITQLMTEVERQRQDTFEFAQGERDLLLKEVNKLRDVTMTNIHSELETVSGMIDKQRMAIEALIKEERGIALEQAEGIKDRALDRLEPKLFEVMDHLAWRLAQIVAVTAICAAVFVLIVIRMMRR